MLHIYIFTISVGFLCNFFATILPFWFAKYPSAKSRFLSLGLWELCLDNFISPLNQQRLYIWFHVAQALQSFSMIIHSVLVGIGFGMLFNVFDKYNPRTVLTSVFLLVLNCWVLLTQLGVVGVNLDLEQKQAENRGSSLWMSEADQSSFSWSFGLAAFVLLFVLVALNILVWCVYPRKERGGRLLSQAWTWPTSKDLPCCLLRNPSYRHAAMEESRRAESLSEQQRIELTRLHRTADPSRDTDLSSLDVGTYDPRSADAMTEGNPSEDNHISSFKMSAAGMKLEEGELYDRRAAVFQSDPRTAVDENLSRVSSRMSSVRSSNGMSGAFDRERNRTYIIKKGQSHITPQTVIPKPLTPGKIH